MSDGERLAQWTQRHGKPRVVELTIGGVTLVIRRGRKRRSIA